MNSEQIDPALARRLKAVADGMWTASPTVRQLCGEAAAALTSLERREGWVMVPRENMMVQTARIRGIAGFLAERGAVANARVAREALETLEAMLTAAPASPDKRESAKPDELPPGVSKAVGEIAPPFTVGGPFGWRCVVDSKNRALTEAEIVTWLNASICVLPDQSEQQARAEEGSLSTRSVGVGEQPAVSDQNAGVEYVRTCPPGTCKVNAIDGQECICLMPKNAAPLSYDFRGRTVTNTTNEAKAVAAPSPRAVALRCAEVAETGDRINDMMAGFIADEIRAYAATLPDTTEWEQGLREAQLSCEEMAANEFTHQTHNRTDKAMAACATAIRRIERALKFNPAQKKEK